MRPDSSLAAARECLLGRRYGEAQNALDAAKEGLLGDGEWSFEDAIEGVIEHARLTMLLRYLRDNTIDPPRGLELQTELANYPRACRAFSRLVLAARVLGRRRGERREALYCVDTLIETDVHVPICDATR